MILPALSAPLRVINALRQRRRRNWPSLPLPSFSVGNLSFGGRGKTPVTAALARHAAQDGRHPAILTRGHGGRLPSGGPLVLRAAGGALDAPWLTLVTNLLSGEIRPAWAWRREAGDEAPWLAAISGAPVGVHPDRCRAAAAVRRCAHPELLILDDGFQSAVQRSADLVLLDPLRDPPFCAARDPLREGAAALDRADLIAVLLGPDAPTPAAMPDAASVLRRASRGIRNIVSGGLTVVVELPDDLEIWAGVGNPDSVLAVARSAGITTEAMRPLGDHRRPSTRQLRRHRRRGSPALLVTEKDAIGWAAACPPAAATWVLGQRIEGARLLWERARETLNL